MTPAHRALVEQAEADAAGWHALHHTSPTLAELLAAAVRELSEQVERLAVDLAAERRGHETHWNRAKLAEEQLSAARRAGLEALELLDERAQCTAPNWRETTDRIDALRSVLEGK